MSVHQKQRWFVDYDDLARPPPKKKEKRERLDYVVIKNSALLTPLLLPWYYLHCTLYVRNSNNNIDNIVFYAIYAGTGSGWTCYFHVFFSIRPACILNLKWASLLLLLGPLA